MIDQRRGLETENSPELTEEELRRLHDLQILDNQLRMGQEGQVNELERMYNPPGQDSKRGIKEYIQDEAREKIKKQVEEKIKKRMAERAAKKAAARQGAKAAAERQVEKQAVKQVGAQVAKRGLLAIFADPITWPILLVILVILLVFISAIIIVILGLENSKVANPQSDIVQNVPITEKEGWVWLTGTEIPVDIAQITPPNEARVKESVFILLQQLYQRTMAEDVPDENRIMWQVTSAYRVNAEGCHGLGEAVDIGIRDPRPVPAVDPVTGETLINNKGFPLFNDPRIFRIKSIASELGGFGEIIDEYNYPTSRATGTHIHLGLRGYKYCLDTDE
jgi:hypothetical protein